MNFGFFGDGGGEREMKRCTVERNGSGKRQQMECAMALGGRNQGQGKSDPRSERER